MLQAWEPARPRSFVKAALLNASRIAHGQTEALEPRDWRFYEEKVRQSHFELDDAVVKPYFELDRMIAAMFGVAGRLFDLSFKEVTHGAGHRFITRMHGCSKCIEGKESAVHLRQFRTFVEARRAWMSSYRVQGRIACMARWSRSLATTTTLPKAPTQPDLVR